MSIKECLNSSGIGSGKTLSLAISNVIESKFSMCDENSCKTTL